jgi:hypothetical protein
MQMFVFIDVSTMPLGALLELRDRIGSRLYEKIVFRQGAGEAQLNTKSIKMSPANSTQPDKFKRDNKKRPREVSSKAKPIEMSLVFWQFLRCYVAFFI